jgi:hypothetical protein
MFLSSRRVELIQNPRKGGSWRRVKILEDELFWNVLVVLERVAIRNSRAFPDILLKRIDTIRPVD